MKLLLFLSAGHLDAQLMAGSKITRQHEFTDSPQDRENFAAFLQQAKHPTYLLVDLIEEEFRHEAVPHLGGRNRNALLQRKLGHFYPDTPFRQALLQQRQKAGRRDDEILFSALTNPALIKPWLEIILAQQIPLAGVYSIPQISAPLIKNHPSNCLLLISWEKQAGLRQTYFRKHRLQISRLTPIGGDLTFQEAVLKELPRTYQYLKSLSLLPPEQILDVRLMGHSHDLIELQLTLPKSADMRYDFADLANVARQLKMDRCFTDSDARPVFMHQLAAHTPQIHYANRDHTHYLALRQFKHALNLASTLLLFGMLIWGAGNLWQSRNDIEEAALLNAQVQHTLNSAQKIILADPGTHAPSADIKTGVSVMRKLDQYTVLPNDILGMFSQVLNRQPQIELDDIAWQINTNETVAPAIPTDVPVHTILIKGHLTADSANSYRATLDSMERFQRDLDAQGYQVTALTKPLDVSPNGSIADQREMPPNIRGFSLRITLRPAS